MKRILLVLLGILSYITVEAQSYYVLHVNGEILKSDESPLAAGDMLEGEMSLIFGNNQAHAVVMSTDAGRMVVDGKNVAKDENGRFLSFVQQAIFPMKSDRQISTRGVDDNIDVKNFEEFFGAKGEHKGGGYLVIGEEFTINYDTETYPESENNIFIYKYQHNGEKVQKIIKGKNGELTFNKAKLYTSHGVYIDPQDAGVISFYFGNKKDKSSFKELVSFKPSFIADKNLKHELDILQKFLTKNDVMEGEELKRELLQYTVDVFGYTNPKIFLDWLETNELVTSR